MMGDEHDSSVKNGMGDDHSRRPKDNENEKKNEKEKEKVYLAQHDLFAQIPSLRADISIPDYCYIDIPPSIPPASSSPPTKPPPPKLETPLLNAWFGPSGTISPLHTDPYHNILSQVVGYKYLRLYAPSATPTLYPRGVDEKGIDMSNTSTIDLDEGMAACPEIDPWSHVRTPSPTRNATSEESESEIDAAARRRAFFTQTYPGFVETAYIEGVLGPGECLYIPPGWWHYVRSLTPSFSVSFWFN